MTIMFFWQTFICASAFCTIPWIFDKKAIGVVSLLLVVLGLPFVLSQPATPHDRLQVIGKAQRSEGPSYDRIMGQVLEVDDEGMSLFEAMWLTAKIDMLRDYEGSSTVADVEEVKKTL